MSDVDQLVKLVEQMSGAIRTLIENQDRLMQQQNHNGQAITDLLHIASNHAETLKMSQAAIERLWLEAGLSFDPPSPQAN